MEIDTVNAISEYLDKTNFFNDQKKLETMYYLMRGYTYREIADKIEKQISFVQRVMDFMRNYKLLYWGRWSPNVYKIGMKKTIAFLSWEDRKRPEKENFYYTTNVHLVHAEEPKTLVIYTFPNDHESRIVGDIGEEITPFYYSHTKFTVPFIKQIDLYKEFFSIFDSIKNDNTIIDGTPSFDIDEMYDDPLTVFICRCAEILDELNPGVILESLKKDKDYDPLQIAYENVRTTLNKMLKNNVLFPRNALYFKPVSYQAALIRIKTNKIYRIMGSFNQFNMLTRMALTRDPNIYYFYIQYPSHQFSQVMEILSELDSDHKAYIETKFIMGDTIWYKWALERYLESKSTK
jgi:hypothetical protein